MSLLEICFTVNEVVFQVVSQLELPQMDFVNRINFFLMGSA
jgi:hypothetical protein